MSRISPFKGVLYHPPVAGDIARLVSPPYDMISSTGQEALYGRDPHNFVRLDYGLEKAGDNDRDNRYTRAAADLDAWLASGVVARDDRPALYVYEQEYSLPRGPRQRRRGFIALAELEEFGGNIHAHEKTLAGPKEDRLRLMESCRTNFSQIFTFYDDPSAGVEAALEAARPAPRFDFTDETGVRHVLSPVHDPATIDAVTRLMNDRPLYIADGHHRYETALTFRRTMREAMGPGYPKAFDRVMMYFTNMSAPGLTILPFHRLVALPPGQRTSDVMARLAGEGVLSPSVEVGDPRAGVERLLALMREASGDEHRFGIWAPPGFHLLTLRRGPAPEGGVQALVDNLDVSILHGTILPAVTAGESGRATVAYATREDDILSFMEAGQGHELAFLLNPTSVAQVRDIAAGGLRMPPKSTNFHPKLVSGLVFNLLAD
jgi:uncharacterized protein (DUF1015 family)